MRLLPRLLAVPILLILLSGCLPAQTAAHASSHLTAAEARRWREDLHYMADQMRKLHKNLYHSVSPERFRAAVDDLDKQIPRLSRDDVIVGFARIVALVGDGHTSFNIIFDPKVKFGYYPVGLYMFKDGLYVYAADPQYASIVGARVTQIGNLSTDEAWNRVQALVSRDNEMGIKDHAPLLLTIPEVLHALSIVDDPSKARLVAERNGQEIAVELKPLPGPRPSGDNWGLGRNFRKMPEWVDAARAEQPNAALSLWLKDPQDYWWFEYLEDSRTLYVQYNGVADKDTETVAEFAKRVFAFADSHPVDRFVLDMRWNFGGNSYLNKPMLLGIIKSNKIDQRGKLFVVIGRRTFSAAQNLVNNLEKYTNVLFIGEPTATRPNFFADTARIVLPHSQLTVRPSALWWQDIDPRDTRVWTGPHIAAELTSDDYKRRSDPAMRVILGYVPQKELTELLLEKLLQNDLQGAISAYRVFKADPANAYVNTEMRINNLGYKLVRMKRLADAIEVFKLNVESYPQSANAYDSLGDAYMQNGDKELAIRNYQKSLELNPANAGASDALRKLRK